MITDQQTYTACCQQASSSRTRCSNSSGSRVSDAYSLVSVRGLSRFSNFFQQPHCSQYVHGPCLCPVAESSLRPWQDVQCSVPLSLIGTQASSNDKAALAWCAGQD